MKFVLYTNSVSAHQLPLARELAKRVGVDNFRYIYTGDTLQGGAQEVAASEPWIIKEGDDSAVHLQPSPSLLSSAGDWLEDCDVLLVGGLRPSDLLERRSAKGLRTFYQSERWFKPMPIRLPIPLLTFTSHLHLCLPGALRLFVPSYRKMARRFVRIMNDDPNFITLPIGPWAKKDFMHLGVRADKMVDWGYFVEPSSFREPVKQTIRGPNSVLHALYIGRLLKLKHVDIIIRAIAYANGKLAKLRSATINYNLITLTVVGDGPEKTHLEKLASDLELEQKTTTSTFTFRPAVPISEARHVMRNYDVLIFASDATDGWGAVVNEALSEGVPVIGTRETGASAALLSDSQLFHCGNYKELAGRLLSLKLQFSTRIIPPAYTPLEASNRLFSLLGEV